MRIRVLNKLISSVAIATGGILLSCNSNHKATKPSSNDSIKQEINDTVTAYQDISDKENQLYPELIDWSSCFTTLPDAEKKLVSWIKSHPNEGKHRDLADDHFHIPFVKLILSHPETLGYSFPLLDKYAEESYGNYMHYETSDDKQLRIYSWNTGCGGTWRIFSSITQYKFSGNTKAIYGSIDAICDGKQVPFPNDDPWENEASFVTEIFDVKDNNGKNNYLIFANRIYSGAAYSYEVMLCELTAKGPRRIKAFKDGNKLTDRLIFSTESRLIEKDADNYAMEPEYNEKSRVLHMPTVKEGGLIDNAVIYKYNGSLFVKEK